MQVTLRSFAPISVLAWTCGCVGESSHAPIDRHARSAVHPFSSQLLLQVVNAWIGTCASHTHPLDTQATYGCPMATRTRGQWFSWTSKLSVLFLLSGFQYGAI